MNIQQNDIIVRTFQNIPTLWVSERLICKELGDGMDEYLRRRARFGYRQSVSPCHQSKDILPATGKSWRYARINGQFYYDYDFIPDRKDTQFRSRLGDKDTLLHAVDMAVAADEKAVEKEQEAKIMEMVLARIDKEDRDDYQFRKVDGACKYNADKARQMAEALSWLRVVRHITEEKRYRELGFKRQEDFLMLCAALIERRKLYGFPIGTAGSLRKKLIYFPVDIDEQREYLISGRTGNDNARKLGKYKLVDTATGEIFNLDMHQAIIADLYMNPGGTGKGSKIELWQQYQEDITYMGLNPISYSSFCHHTGSYDERFKTAFERHGKSHFNSTYLPYISGEKPVYANSLWCIDGSGTIGYRYYDKEGDMRSMRLYVMMVSDVATGKIVGWCPSVPGEHSETHRMVQGAMLMAANGCDRHEAFELVSDNGSVLGKDKGRQYLEQFCRFFRSIEPGNSQGNYAETQFRLFKKRLRRMLNWMGTSWDAKSIENKNNEDYMNVIDYPTYEEAVAQLGEKIEEWNNSNTRAGISRSQLYAENMHPDCKPIDERIWRKLTGRFSKKEITRQRGTIQLESQGNEYKFDIPDYESLGELVQKYLGYANLVNTLIYWDNDCADVYTECNRYMFSCLPTQKATITHAEATPEGMAAIGKGFIRKEKVRSVVDSYTEEVKTVAEAIYNEHPERYGIVCRQTKHAKERTNGEREAAMEAKARQNRKATKKKPAPVLVDAYDGQDEYTQMKKEMYKNKAI